MDEKTKERRTPRTVPSLWGGTTVWRTAWRSRKRSMKVTVKRGDIFYADLSPVIGSEQGGLRPVLVIQNDVGNRYSPTVIVAAITSRLDKAKLPTHIDISISDRKEHTEGLAKDSVVLLEQVRTVDKRRLRERMGHISPELMGSVDKALLVSFGLMPREEISEELRTTDIRSDRTAVAASTITPPAKTNNRAIR